MKKNNKLLLPFLLALFAIGCSPKIQTLVSGWQAQPLALQSETGWIAPVGTDSKSNLEYAITNDRENLYISLQTNDPATRLRIMRAGMELQIQSAENSKNPGIIKYPLPEERITLFDGLGRQEGPRDRNRQDPREMFERVMANQTKLNLSGFINHPNGSVPLENENGINIGMDISGQGTLTYKAIVPLNTLLADPLTEKTGQTRLLLTININALDIPSGPPGSFSGPGLSGRNRMSPNDPRYREGASAPRPGSGYMMGADNDRLTRSETIKIAFSLATASP